MDLVLVGTLLLAVIVGISLGLLGGGGSILTVPILTYVVGMDAQEAIAASLFIVGTTSAVSTLSHARAHRVRWRTGLVFGAAGMAGAFVGGLLGGFVPGTVLLLLFAAMMIATATAMIRGRSRRTAAVDDAARPLPVARLVLDGFLVGIATGLVGAGGGFLVVPALTLLGGLPVAVAIGTSLLVITMKSFAGLGATSSPCSCSGRSSLRSPRQPWPVRSSAPRWRGRSPRSGCAPASASSYWSWGWSCWCRSCRRPSRSSPGRDPRSVETSPRRSSCAPLPIVD